MHARIARVHVTPCQVQLAKRVLREVALLRFLAGHDNITGLIDLDAPGNVHDFNEMYVVAGTPRTSRSHPVSPVISSWRCAPVMFE